METSDTGGNTAGSTDEFVTVPAAASLLGLSERTAQRYASRLADTDRHVSDSDGLRRVRVSAMLAEAKRASVKRVATQPRQVSGTVGVAAGSVAPNVGDVPDSVGSVVSALVAPSDAALVAQLQSEVAFLRDELKTANAHLEASNANTAAALAELSRAREQNQLVLGAVAANRLQITPGEASQAQTVGDNDNDGQGVGSVPGAAQRGKWWQIWKRM